MSVLLLILCLTFPAQDWKLIKEMSGDIPNHPGLTVETYAAEIARGDDLVKLLMRIDLPGGAPYAMFRGHVPHGFDVSSISRMTFKAEFNCKTLVMKPIGGTGNIYQFNGKKHKSKEPPFKLEYTHVFAEYFCERPSSAPSTELPKLKKSGKP